jgi:hypothetical protein
MGIPVSDNVDDLFAAIEESSKEEERKTRPSRTIVVYCDKHLGVKMALAESWILGESGRSSAAANRLSFWRCPKAGCERCYEPMTYGYFPYAGEMGSRIELNPNPEDQPRGNHLELPFMYIGKVGQGRRYLCPLYKCNEEGPEVASPVLDEEVAIPRDPLESFGKEEKKRVIEMTTFKLFALVSGLALDDGIGSE